MYYWYRMLLEKRKGWDMWKWDWSGEGGGRTRKGRGVGEGWNYGIFTYLSK